LTRGVIERRATSSYWVSVRFLSEAGIRHDRGDSYEAKKTEEGDGRVSEFVHGGYPFKQAQDMVCCVTQHH